MNLSCCRKEDNHWWTEKEWQAKAWTEEEKHRNAALPHHMWNWKQNDRIWPMCKQYRGENALGPRAEGYPDKFIPDLPVLIKGRGIARWMSSGDKSVAEVPAFADYKKRWTVENMPEIINFIERNPGNPNYGKKLTYAKKNFIRTYAPSSIQKFSRRSLLVRFPDHLSWHRMIKKNEVAGKSKKETGADLVLFYRNGIRWDSYDRYFIKKAIYFGLRWN